MLCAQELILPRAASPREDPKRKQAGVYAEADAFDDLCARSGAVKRLRRLLASTGRELAACKTLENAKSWSLRTRGNDPGHEGDAAV